MQDEVIVEALQEFRHRYKKGLTAKKARELLDKRRGLKVSEKRVKLLLAEIEAADALARAEPSSKEIKKSLAGSTSLESVDEPVAEPVYEPEINSPPAPAPAAKAAAKAAAAASHPVAVAASAPIPGAGLADHEPSEQEILAAIASMIASMPDMGAKKVRANLQRHGWKVSDKRVKRLLNMVRQRQPKPAVSSLVVESTAPVIATHSIASPQAGTTATATAPKDAMLKRVKTDAEVGSALERAELLKAKGTEAFTQKDFVAAEATWTEALECLKGVPESVWDQTEPLLCALLVSFAIDCR
eukprot:SAG11_NODE_11_length_27870_cov_16.327428_15_plen_300_part_00